MVTLQLDASRREISRHQNVQAMMWRLQATATIVDLLSHLCL